MIIEYTPEGGETQRLDAGRLRASEIQIIERTADRPWDDIKAAMRVGEITALRTVAWAVKKRTEPTLRYSEFDPFEDELRVRLDARETRAYAEAIVERYGSDPDELAKAFEELREVAADREACEAAIADVTAPKAPVPSPGQSPASPSDA